MPHFQAHECPPPSSSFPVGESLFSDTLRFQAHQPAPLSSSPPASKSSCFQAHQPAPPSSSPPASKSSHFQAHQPAPPSSSPPASKSSRFQAHQPAPPSSSPPGSESSFVTCRISKLTNPLLPLPLLQEVSADASAQSPQSCGSELLSPHITVHVPPIVGDHKRDVQEIG